VGRNAQCLLRPRLKTGKLSLPFIFMDSELVPFECCLWWIMLAGQYIFGNSLPRLLCKASVCDSTVNYSIPDSSDGFRIIQLLVVFQLQVWSVPTVYNIPASVLLPICHEWDDPGDVPMGVWIVLQGWWGKLIELLNWLLKPLSSYSHP
jgi:hypothetical protein